MKEFEFELIKEKMHNFINEQSIKDFSNLINDGYFCCVLTYQLCMEDLKTELINKL